MAWFSALALLAIVLCAAGALRVVLRRRRRSSVEAQTEALPPEPTSEPAFVGDVALIEQQASEAEAAGDCERAAELFESVGMLQRAIHQYRCAGNIQKAAELELVGMELGRLSQHVEIIGSEPSPEPFGAGEEFDFDMPEPDADYLHTHPTMRPRSNSIPAQALPSFVPTVAPNPTFSTLPPLSPTKKPSSAPPAKKKSAPPARVASERPRPRTPTVEELEGMLGPSPTPDLGNIEIYYRLGLAHLAANSTDKALQAFTIVEEISPGYRDAEAYLAQLAPAAAKTFERAPANSNERAHDRSDRNARARTRHGAIEEVRVATGRRDDR